MSSILKSISRICHEESEKEKLNRKLENVIKKHGFVEPNRGDLDDPTISWRTQKPDYTKANLAFFSGKTMNHKADSLEKIVEDLVKTWEMEASHKIDFAQWNTVDQENFTITGNGGKVFTRDDCIKFGNYNILMENCSKDVYDSTKEDFESSHHLFRNTFIDGFAWELLKVFSGPPKVAFSWRHWGKFNGTYKNNNGNNEIVEMYGFAVVQVNEKLKIQSIEIFYEPKEFLEVLEGKRKVDDLKNGKSIIGSSCPFIKNKK